MVEKGITGLKLFPTYHYHYGALTCTENGCGKVLTGSASKGHTKHYAYYHCSRACTNSNKPCRLRADSINDRFLYEIKKYIPRPEMVDLYKVSLTEAWYDPTARQPDE